MNRLLVLAGLLLTLPLGAEASVYQDLRAAVEREQSRTTFDQDLVEYLATLFEVPQAAVTETLKGDVSAACAAAQKTIVGCNDLTLRILQAYKNEAAIRTLGRKLQEVAGGEEVPVSYLPGRPISLFFDLSALLTLWAPGDQAPKTLGKDLGLTARMIRKEDYEELYEKLEEAADELFSIQTTEELTAAVWRYDAGVRLVRETRMPQFPAPFIDDQSGAGTERQYLFKRWDGNLEDDEAGIGEEPDIEQPLLDAWNALPADDTEPGMITYYQFPDAEGMFPSNAIVWARKGYEEKPTDSSSPERIEYGDIGITWKQPIEPVLPSLKDPKKTGSGAAIRGGRYPPEPTDASVTPPERIDGRKLCTDPVAARGFLCSSELSSKCPDPDDADPDAINIVNCETAEEKTTSAGANICLDIDWRRTPAYEPGSGFDPNRQCYLEQVCASGPFSGGITKEKEADGKIRVEVNPNPDIPATYYWIHELTHARQTCQDTPGTQLYIMDDEGNFSDDPNDMLVNAEVCCRYEGEGYRAQCDAMEEDGLFLNDDGSRLTIEGIEIDATTCAELYTDASCVQRVGMHCPRSREYRNNEFPEPPGPFEALNPFLQPPGDSITIQMEEAIAQRARANPKVPFSCADSLDPDQKDPRQEARELEISRMYEATKLGNAYTFRNTVGNNMCYIGQAAEETLETRNLTPGRVPSVTGDQAGPFHQPVDRSLPELNGEDPQYPTVDVPLKSLPTYRPRAVAQQFDAAQCQLQGLPPLNPPILCIAQANRRLQLPIADYVLNTDTILQQQSQQQQTKESFENIASGLGGRLATGIYEQYAPKAVAELTSLLREAVRQLKLLPEIPFPEEMCALGPTT